MPRQRQLAEAPATLPEAPHYLGHRERLRTRFREAGAGALGDYELLELLLFRVIPRRDVKPIAKALLQKFGSFAEVIAAPEARLMEVKGIKQATATHFRIVHAAATRMLRQELKQAPLLSSGPAVLDYCRSAMAFADKEQFRILFLDKRHHLIADEVQQTGTVDHTPVYPREVIERALALRAMGMILVHNHPSGDPHPSTADIQMTQAIIELARPLGIAVHDHIIVGRHGHTSLKAARAI